MSCRSASEYVIRRCRVTDRPAIRRICVACCWMGRYEPRRIPDEWIWAEYWTRYFTDREPRHCWVAERRADGQVIGYLTGTADADRVGRHLPFLLPGILWRVIRKRLIRNASFRAAVWSMLTSLARGELSLPASLRRRFPATFHLNLLAEARGRGVGSQLLAAFVQQMRSLRVPGVHAQSLSANPVMPAFLARRGFKPAASCPLHAFSRVDSRPIDLQTWVLAL